MHVVTIILFVAVLPLVKVPMVLPAAPELPVYRALRVAWVLAAEVSRTLQPVVPVVPADLQGVTVV